MELLQHLAKARASQQTKAAERRASQVFILNWRATGAEIVVGWANVARLLGIKESTLATRLSASGNSYAMRRVNPQHGELDILTVSRQSTAKALSVAKRGRKPRLLDVDRLGEEALYDVRHKR